jgi:hypothetical protein
MGWRIRDKFRLSGTQCQVKDFGEWSVNRSLYLESDHPGPSDTPSTLDPAAHWSCKPDMRAQSLLDNCAQCRLIVSECAAALVVALRVPMSWLPNRVPTG